MKQGGSLVVADNVVDPLAHGRDPGVDAGVVGLGTPDAPGHDTDLGALAVIVALTLEQRSARVALKNMIQCS